MTPVELSAAAVEDIRRLRVWLEERAPGQGRKVVTLLINAALTLEDLPARGRTVPDSVLRELVVRFGSSAYLMRYRIYKDRVVIVTIVHSRERR
ncbi:MAG: plasmid stabilization system [Caulobacter sp.]|nr:plasmid stabilization system [Caulobacter sp.]